MPTSTNGSTPPSRRMRSDSVERLRRRVKAARGEWSQVAPAAEVNYKTLVRFANGDSKRPWSAFLTKLDEYFRRVDAGRPQPGV